MIKIKLNKEFEKTYYHKIVDKSGNYKGLKYKFDTNRTTENAAILDFIENITITKNHADSILVQKPENLSKSIESIKGFGTKDEINKLYKTLLKKIFDYDSFKKRIGFLYADELMVDVCPYCNRNWTPNIQKQDGKSFRSAFDHYYPESDYPYLAISLYNLIPVCHSCNQFKSNNQEYFNPFETGYTNDIIFNRIPLNVDGIISNAKMFTLRIDLNNSVQSERNKKIKNQIKNLRLDTLYKKFHNKHILNLIKRSYIYNEDYLTEIYNQYQGTLFSSMDELKSIIFGAPMQEEDIGKMPLGKLTYDILKELRGEE